MIYRGTTIDLKGYDGINHSIRWSKIRQQRNELFRFQIIKRSQILLVSSYLFFLICVLLYSLDITNILLYISGFLAIISSIFLMRISLLKALYIAILCVLIGPVIRINSPIGMINIGDLYIGLLFIFFLRGSLRTGIYLGPFRNYLLCIIFLCFINFLLSEDYKAAIIGYIIIFQIVLVYFITLNEIKTYKDGENLLKAIGFAVFIGCLLQIYFYAQGKSLNLSAEAVDQSIYITGWISNESYIKTTYFFGGFTGAMIVAATLGLRNIFFPENFRLQIFAFWCVATPVIIASAVVQASRVSIICIFISLILIILLQVKSTINNLNVIKFIKLSLYLIFICLIVYAIYLIQATVVNELQRAVYYDTLIGGASISFKERLDMWSLIFKTLAKHLKVLLIGLGPGVPSRAPDSDLVKEIYRIQLLPQDQIYSFHNFYVDVIFQLGIINFIFFILVIVLTLKMLITLLRYYRNDIVLDCFLAISAWLIMWNSHAPDWNRAYIIFYQLFALVHVQPFGKEKKYLRWKLF